jgi:hypothetical protein
VAKALHGLTDTVARAFSPRTRSSEGFGDVMEEIQQLRRMSHYHRDRYIVERRRRRPTAVRANDVKGAVLEALRDGEPKTS